MTTLDEMMRALAERGHTVKDDRADGCKVAADRYGHFKVSGRSVFAYGSDPVAAVAAEVKRATQRRPAGYAKRQAIGASLTTKRVAVAAQWGAGWTVELTCAIGDESQLRALVAAIEDVLAKPVQSQD